CVVPSKKVAVAVARMLALPLATPVARPAPLTVATPAVAEDHVTCPVILGWVPSLYAPVTVNCWVLFTGKDWLAGVTAIETKATLTTGGAAAPVPPQPVRLVTSRTKASANAPVCGFPANCNDDFALKTSSAFIDGAGSSQEHHRCESLSLLRNQQKR